MTKKQFTRAPAALRPLPDEEVVEKFAAAAVERTASQSKPWEKLDPKGKATAGINLRLNEYQLTLLRHIAEAEDRSLQQTIKRLLIPAAEKAAADLER